MRLEKIVSNQNKLREHNLDTATARWKIKLKTIKKIQKNGVESKNIFLILSTQRHHRKSFFSCLEFTQKLLYSYSSWVVSLIE